MADKKLNEVTTINTTTLNNVKNFLAVMNDGSIQQMSKQDMASVVGGLIGTANTNKDGLMPSYRAMNILYSEGKPIKITISENEGFALLFTAVKNHESSGQSIITVSGYSNGIIATSIRRGSYISGISYNATSSGIDIYVKLLPYVFFSSLVLLTSSPTMSYSVTLSDSVPVGASEVSVS